MKIAYLIDCESLGGGCEYIRRKSDERRLEGDECRTFYADRGECRAKTINDWGADKVVVNHLKALLQLMGRPWERPRGRVRFVVHGIHLRKYRWMMLDAVAEGLTALPRRGVAWMCFQARRMLETWLYHRCDEIVALTEGDRSDILRLYGRDLRVDVEPNTIKGWTPRLEAPHEAWARLIHSYQGDKPNPLTPLGGTRPRYVCIGRFNYQKGQDRWIRYLAAHAPSPASGASSRSFHTLFIGGGDRLEFCKKLAADLGVADQCIFIEEIPDAELCLQCAETVVSPSRWEGMPYLLMKARALGCRILATDCPGNRDVLAGYEKWERLSL